MLPLPLCKLMVAQYTLFLYDLMIPDLIGFQVELTSNDNFGNCNKTSYKISPQHFEKNKVT